MVSDFFFSYSSCRVEEIILQQLISAAVLDHLSVYTGQAGHIKVLI